VIGGHASVTGRALLPAKRRPWLIAGAVALCAWCFVVRHWYSWPASIHGFPNWENKNSLAPVRLLDTFALFLLIHFAFVRWPHAFNWRPLALLGRHSLMVFSAHIVLAYLLLAFPEIFAATPFQAWMGTLIMLSTLFAVAVWREGARQTGAAAGLPRPALARARVRVSQ
jgi:hypothetical protein